MSLSTKIEEEVLESVLEDIKISSDYSLIVFNDDVNTFDHVIDTLIDVCKHSQIQAEQCTHIIHNNGKCSVKTGSFDPLKDMRERICEAGISAEILQ